MAKAVEPPTVLERFQQGQVDEWGVYVAVVAIDIGGARAFNPGAAVPASHVTRGVVSGDPVRERTDEPEEPAVPAGPVVYRRGMGQPAPDPEPETKPDTKPKAAGGDQ